MQIKMIFFTLVKFKSIKFTSVRRKKKRIKDSDYICLKILFSKIRYSPLDIKFIWHAIFTLISFSSLLFIRFHFKWDALKGIIRTPPWERKTENIFCVLLWSATMRLLSPAAHTPNILDRHKFTSKWTLVNNKQKSTEFLFRIKWNFTTE